MKPKLIIAMIIALVILTAAGYYFFVYNKTVVRSAQPYVDAGAPVSDMLKPMPADAEVNSESTEPPPDTVETNSTQLSTGTTLTELEADLDAILIEEEDFSDL